MVLPNLEWTSRKTKLHHEGRDALRLWEEAIGVMVPTHHRNLGNGEAPFREARITRIAQSGQLEGGGLRISRLHRVDRRCNRIMINHRGYLDEDLWITEHHHPHDGASNVNRISIEATLGPCSKTLHQRPRSRHNDERVLLK